MGLFDKIETETMKCGETTETSETSSKSLGKHRNKTGVVGETSETSPELLDISPIGDDVTSAISRAGALNGEIHYLTRLAMGYTADPAFPIHGRCVGSGHIDERGRFTKRGFDFWWAQTSGFCVRLMT
jgi:hypothetical protein